MRQRLLLIISILLATMVVVRAQTPKVESSISSMQMLIGEQVAVTVTAHASDTATVVFPTTIQIPTAVELIGAVIEPDKDEGNGMISRSRSYVLTSFADADTLFSLPPIKVVISNKEYETKPLALKVMTIDVDTTNVEKYFGPKTIQEIPFSWTEDEWNKLLAASFLFIIFIAVGLFLYVRLRSNKPIITRIKIVKRLLPHQKAMKAIENIKAEKMVSAEDPKLYYTKLTDALRQYIDERYGFSAMEMTSGEIIQRLTTTGDTKSLMELKQLFETADLVKFAKYSTLINENDANLMSAIEFINQTKIENMPTEEVIKPDLTEEQMHTQQHRRVLKVLIAIAATAAAVLLAYIIWFMFDMM